MSSFRRLVSFCSRACPNSRSSKSLGRGPANSCSFDSPCALNGAVARCHAFWKICSLMIIPRPSTSSS